MSALIHSYHNEGGWKQVVCAGKIMMFVLSFKLKANDNDHYNDHFEKIKTFFIPYAEATITTSHRIQNIKLQCIIVWVLSLETMLIYYLILQQFSRE